MTAIRLQAVQKRFRTVTVLPALDLNIASGEFFTFLGPSGCGKSTILNLIAGIETPSGGDIFFDGQRVTELGATARDVAMVFQSYALYPHMTVRENLAFPLKNKRLARAAIDTAVAATAEQLGLTELLERKPRELSGGQRQRVALGRALVRKPRVFLLDEPLSNLDARLRLEMREELKRLHAELGITTVYVTHDQEEALALSGRIALLDHGQIQQCGTPLEIYEQPANLFVASFIGAPPMIVLDGARCTELAAARERVDPELLGRLWLGIRPADVRVTARPADHAIAAEVLLAEPTGAELWVVGAWQDQRIKGRAAPGEQINPGQRAYFSIRPACLHVFDKSSGKVVTSR